MRPSVRAREERKWVVDTVNKYFDVIVEDEEGDSERSSDEGKAMSWIYQEVFLLSFLSPLLCFQST